MPYSLQVFDKATYGTKAEGAKESLAEFIVSTNNLNRTERLAVSKELGTLETNVYLYLIFAIQISGPLHLHCLQER